MSTAVIARVTGASAIVAVACWLSQFPLYMVGPPSVYDGAAYAAHLKAIGEIAFTRILLDLGGYISAMVFSAGFRELVKQRRPELEWVGTLLFGAGVVWLAVTLVADGLAGGAVLDSLAANPDGSAVRALIEGTLLIYNSATCFVVTGFYLVVAGYLVMASGLLPRWNGWIAYAGAVLCLACVPALFGGAVDYAGPYNAGSFVPAVVANFLPALWFVTAGLVLVMARMPYLERIQ